MQIKTITKNVDLYNQLVNENFPVINDKSIWAQNTHETSNLPKQGFKLHISANLLECHKVLKIVINELKNFHIVYKVCKNVSEVKKINTGLYYGESQIGKIVTIYPKNISECREIADLLHRKTERFNVVDIPFDIQYKKNSNVFYRYGLNKKNKSNTLIINGTKVEDSRKFRNAIPEGIGNPLPQYQQNNKNFKRYLLTKALIKRGKGSTFSALQFKNNAVRNCILKEGKKNGEVYYDKKDGFSRIMHEEKVLQKLKKVYTSIPSVLEAFNLNNNRYLILEQIEGITLNRYIKKNNKVSFEAFKLIAMQVVEILNKIHDSNLVWRDCKADNFIINSKTKLVTAIDFEGSCKKDSKQLISWSSPGFTPPEADIFKEQIVTEKFDSYSFGCLLIYIITGEILLEEKDKMKIMKIHRKFPSPIIVGILQLLDTCPKRRLSVMEYKSLLANY